MDKQANTLQETSEHLLGVLDQVIIGKHHVLETALISFLCQGHLLIEDIPGVGKTVLAKALAKLSGCEFRRIQFTPDLLPTDVVGATIFNQQTNQFEIRKGPIFGQVILADEINRATPKTQSALLEAMDERQVTIEGVAHLLPKPFIVIATQNPIEYEGTFPLPEAQLDRFFMKLSLGYPSKTDEVNILTSQEEQHPLNNLQPILDPKKTMNLMALTQRVFVSDVIKRYIVDIVQATRTSEDVFIGASPRGSLALMRAAQAKAAISGREYVIPDDVQHLVTPMLSHRVILNVSARMNEVAVDHILGEVLSRVPAPGGTFSRQS